MLTLGALSIQPKSQEISVGSSNGTDHLGLVRPEYSGPVLKVVHCDRSGHFGRSDRNFPFHLPKLLSPVPLFSILLTPGIVNRTQSNSIRGLSSIEFGNRTKSNTTATLSVSSISEQIGLSRTQLNGFRSIGSDFAILDVKAAFLVAFDHTFEAYDPQRI